MKITIENEDSKVCIVTKEGGLRWAIESLR